MVGILEGLAPGRRGVSEVSEQAERVSMSSEVSEASLPLRLLARLPARLPARLAGPLVEDGVRLVSERPGLVDGVAPPFSPVKEPRLEWKVGLLSLDVEPPLEEAVGVAGAEGSDAQLWALCDADEDERVGEAVRDEGLDRRPRDRKAARPCEAPSGRMNFSRSSKLVRPRARQGSFFTRNSSRAIHPPPTRTMTVLRKIRTRRSCCESPN